MRKQHRKLWIQALEGSALAYRRLGAYFWRTKYGRDRKLARLCLEKAVEMGDEKAFLIYHRLFSKGKKVIDDKSYALLWKEYRETEDEAERRRLKKYLRLGTREQRRFGR